MKALGVIGGIGPESTIQYYRFLIAAYQARRPDGSQPPIFINSIDVQHLLGLVGAGHFDDLVVYLLAEIRKLAAAGADFALLAANTPHIVFEELRALSPIHLLSIVEATCEQVQAQGLRRPALFGTRFTMKGRFYPEVFERAGITIITPDAADEDYIHHHYVTELLQGRFLPQTREVLFSIVDRLRERKRIDCVILGGTELPLILQDDSHHGIPLLDTSRIHAARAIDLMLS
jgi:aspartate racemase